MKLIPTSVLALSLLVTAAPFAAFAEDGGDGNVQAGGSVQSSGPLGALHALFQSDGGNVKFEASNDGSTSDDRITASTTMEMHGGPGKDGMGSTTMNHGNGNGNANKNGNGVQARDRGDGEITSRIDSLNKMIARLNDATRLTPDAKASLSAELTAQITALTNLKTQIDSSATTTLKTDVQSITKDFRVYALVLPKAAIDAAADRIMTIAAQMETLSTKITARITATQTAGVDVSAAVTAHTDFDAKVADAKVQATAAVNEVANLSVDAGATTTLAANTTALKDAKTKIDAAQADLKAARMDVDTILKAIKGKGIVAATTTASAQ